MSDTQKLQELVEFLEGQNALNRGKASVSCQEIRTYIEGTEEPFARYTLDETSPYFKQVKKKKCGCF